MTRKSATLAREPVEEPEILEEEAVVEEEPLEDDPEPEEEPVEEAPVEEEPAPVSFTQAQVEEMTQAAVAKALEQVKVQAPVAPAPAPEPRRSPMALANEWATASGITDWEKIQEKALAIQSEQTKEDVLGAIAPLLAPLVASSTISEMSNGDTALAAETQSLMKELNIQPGDLMNPAVKTLVAEAAKFRASQKTDKPARPFAQPAPASSAAASTPARGVRGQLSPQQTEALAKYEKSFGKYSDEMIRQEFGIQ